MLDIDEISKTCADEFLFFNIPFVTARSCLFLSTIRRSAPSASNLKAVDLPMPDPAPVITTILFLNLSII